MIDAFYTIVHKERRKEIVPFLQTLTPQHKKELIPEIKKLVKKHLDFKPDGISFRPMGNERHRTILLYAAFVCYNRSDFEKFPMSNSILEPGRLNELIDWYCPEWFNEYVDKLARDDFRVYPMTYNWMMELNERGFITPSPELVAKLLPMFINERVDNKFRYAPENLLRYPATLAEHVWHLFELDSNIYQMSRWNADGTINKESPWMTALKSYVEGGQLDRMRLLRESLQAGNRNFNKVACGWFIELFSELAPAKEELLQLQKELFAALSATHSKTVNNALQCIKKIVTDKQFLPESFLDYLPVLLSSSIKSIIASALMIAEKLAARNPEKREQIVQATMQVFIQADDDLQSRAAKLIHTNKEVLDERLQADLASFAPSMLSSARKSLEPFMVENTGFTGTQQMEETPLPATNETALVPIPAIDSMDDLVFIVSQAFDNNQSWHIDIMPATLVKMLPDIQGAEIAKLEPALQRALKIIRTGLTANLGLLDHMLAVFFMDVCLYLVKSRGKDAAVLNVLFEEHRKGLMAPNLYWQYIDAISFHLAKWKTADNGMVYEPHKRILLAALDMITREQRLPLMSTPTHEPGWIDPEVLVERLLSWQNAGQWPDDIDLQVAMSRCYLRNTSAAIILAEATLQGEYKELCLFLLGKDPEPSGILNHPGAWMTASLALENKQPYAALEPFGFYGKPFSRYDGQAEWESVEEAYTVTRWNYQLGRNESVLDRHGVIKVYFNRHPGPQESPEKQGLLKNIFSKLLSKTKEVVAPPVPIIVCDLLRLKKVYFGNNDIRRILLLTPNNPEPLLSTLLDTSLSHPTLSDDTTKKLLVAVLQTLLEIWHHPREMLHVVVATCMLSSDKTVAGMAGEIWLQQVPAGQIDSTAIGRTVGLHARIELTPMKRFTDLLSQSLMRISATHNRQLQIMMEHVLQELPDEPVKNLKKLLEIYRELLDVNKEVINIPVILQKLQAWKNTTALQKVTGQLLAGQ